MDDLDHSFDEPDDFELCNGVFCRFADRNNTINVESYELPERIITLVWHSSGIIGNGGFHYLLEGDFNGDPNFVLTAAAYRSIGAEECYACFQDVMRIFPDCRLPSDIETRLEMYEAVPAEERWEIDLRFFNQLNQKEINRLLAKYIRNHKREISRLLAQP